MEDDNKVDKKEETKYHFDITPLFDSFKKHINIKGNDRIFFSGKFGSGKTCYLNEFFATEESEKEYEVIHLYPVKYQARPNDNISELIRADILNKLIELNEKEDYKGIFKGVGEKEKIKEIKDALLGTFGGMIPFVKVDLKSIESVLNKSKTNIEQNVSNVLKNHFEEIIEGVLANIKREFKKKKVILIIDDLDRLQPEYAFQLLNIFSPTTDADDNFCGFDKVIVVSDYDNLKNIYVHLYGEKTDFKGYIDKFYSKVTYEFDLIAIILEDFDKFFNESFGKYLTEKNNENEIQTHYWFKTFLYLMITNQCINFRNLANVSKYPIRINPFNNNQKMFGHVKDNCNVSSEIIYFLRDLLGSSTKYKEILSKKNMDEQILETFNRFKTQQQDGIISQRRLIAYWLLPCAIYFINKSTEETSTELDVPNNIVEYYKAKNETTISSRMGWHDMEEFEDIIDNISVSRILLKLEKYIV